MAPRWDSSLTTALRNGAILVGLAIVFTFLGDGLDLTAAFVNQLLLIAIATGIAIFAIRYFRANPLRWYVIKKPLRVIVIACAIAIAVLLLIGPFVASDVLSPGMRFALVAVFALAIAWIVSMSRRN